MLRRASWSERLDDEQTPATAGAWEREDARLLRGFFTTGLRGGGVDGEKFANAGDIGGAIAIAEEPVVADDVLGAVDVAGPEPTTSPARIPQP